MAEKTLQPVDRDVELLKVYNIGTTDVCVAMRDLEDRKCIDQYYQWEAVLGTVIPGLESGLLVAQEILSQPVQPNQKKPKPVVTIYVINPKDEPDEKCHLRIKDAEKLLTRLRELAAQRTAA